MNCIELKGRAALGLAPRVQGLLAAPALPTMVCLGRNRPKARPQALKLTALLKDVKAISIPASCDWYTKASDSIRRMYLNDRYGDCVFAGKAHNLGIWSANDPDSMPDGKTVVATDQEISDQYFAYTGGRDNGANISEVYDIMKAKGFQAGGKLYKIDGYVSCDWRSKELVQIGLNLFGAASIGINLPEAWTQDDVWDATNTDIVGGHDVSPCGYGSNVLGTTADGVVIVSWGRLYLVTWKAFTSTQWLEEMYFAVPSFLWTGADKKTPLGINFDELKADLARISGGDLPPLPGPEPIPEPTPTPTPAPTPTPEPPPPLPTLATVPTTISARLPSVLGNIFGSISIAIPALQVAAAQGPQAEYAAFCAKLKPMIDFHPDWATILQDAWGIYQAAKTGSWDAIIQAVMKLVTDILAGLNKSQADAPLAAEMMWMPGLFRRCVDFVRAQRAEGKTNDEILAAGRQDYSLLSGKPEGMPIGQWVQIIVAILQIVLMFL